MKEKTFYKALMEFSMDPNKSKLTLKDKRPTVAEKLIISGLLMIRNSQNLEAIESLKSIQPSELYFVESQRLFLIGCASNNLSHFNEAEKYLISSLNILKNIEAPYFYFLTSYTLFWIYANTNETLNMERMIKEMSQSSHQSGQSQLRLLRCQFCYYQIIQNDALAEIALEEIEAQKSSLSEGDVISYLTDKFIFFIQKENFSKGHETLVEMKKYRKFQMTENYNYMKKLLAHLSKDSPLYAYDQDFEKVPVLLHQIKVIQSLEENKLDLANYHWNSLKTIFPNAYKENFNYVGMKCLFSLCLDKHKKKSLSFELFNISNYQSKLDALIELLEQSNGPVPAGLIYELIWGESPKDKIDIRKVSNLVSKAKVERQLDIEFRKGNYEVLRKKIKKVS